MYRRGKEVNAPELAAYLNSCAKVEAARPGELSELFDA
jgi:hypothetical protein